MRTFLKLLVFLGAMAASAAHARDLLREIVHPKADLPAFHCLVPADWHSEVDASGNLQLANDDRSANFSLSLMRSSGSADTLDALARAILSRAINAPWDSREPAEISGHRGYKYSARVRHTNGVEVRAEIILAAVGGQNIAACSMLLSTKIGRDDETTARLVHAAIKLIPPP